MASEIALVLLGNAHDPDIGSVDPSADVVIAGADATRAAALGDGVRRPGKRVVVFVTDPDPSAPSDDATVSPSGLPGPPALVECCRELLGSLPTATIA